MIQRSTPARGRSPRNHVALLGILTAGACSNVLGPDRGNPAQYAFADSVQFSCGGWSPAPPTAELGLFDIPGTLANLQEPEAQARQRLLQEVLAVDGTIVKQYNLLMVRAIVPVSRVPELGSYATLHGVVRRELKGNTFRVFVAFRGGLFPSVIEARGGTILRVYDAFNAVLAMLPDPAVPAVQQDQRVLFVEQALSYDCLI